ncbi:alpha tubulin suppressor [Coemansia sp. IMI 209128]|nr:alpha tubulin suppressor [Coemansia sp. RSA 2530]KAJ2703564.1 alpha tubulin suppressor [Coemansia sp. IMI 209128]
MVLVHALGSNSGGQLATGDLDDVHHLAATRPLPESPTDCAKWRVCGGGNHTFMWTDRGPTLLGCGSNTDGELALSKEIASPLLCWTPVPFPGSHIQQIACGWSHTLLLNDQGHVYAAGSNTFGQLGAPSSAPWQRVAPGSRFVSIACGMRHSLALDTNGVVYGWGANRNGQLGIEPKGKQPNIPVTPVSRGLGPIAMMACGRTHSILIASDRKTVYVAGQDKYAQWGPSAWVSGTWRAFQLPRPALKVCSGWDFAAVLLEGEGHSNVAMWGRADQGQLAYRVDGAYRRDLDYVDLPDVSDIACGSSHTVALTAGGSVFMWGWNEHGNAGDPTLNNVYTPLCVHENRPQGAVGIGCGYGNSFIVS